MASNLMGHVTTAKRADTVSEVIGSDPTRFQTIRDAQKMSDAGSPAWNALRATDGIYRFVMRLMMTRRIKSR